MEDQDSTPSASTADEIEEVMEKIVKKDVTLELGNGKTVTIYRCKLRHIGMITTFIEEMMKDLGVTTLDGAKQISADLKNPQVLLNLISKKSEEAFAAAADLCDLSHQELLDLDLDDGIRVVSEVWAVNRGFFFSTVIPILTRLGVVAWAGAKSAPKDMQDEDSSTPFSPSSKKGSKKKKS